MKYLTLFLTALMVAVLAAQCAPAAKPEVTTESKLPLFYGAFATPIEEPWDGVIHSALLQAASEGKIKYEYTCLLYTSPSPRDRTRSRMPSSA